jgi:hypothetical protein
MAQIEPERPRRMCPGARDTACRFAWSSSLIARSAHYAQEDQPNANRDRDPLKRMFLFKHQVPFVSQIVRYQKSHRLE